MNQDAQQQQHPQQKPVPLPKPTINKITPPLMTVPTLQSLRQPPTPEGNRFHDGCGLLGALSREGCIVTNFTDFLTKIGYGSSRIYESEYLMQQVAITETSLEMVENKYKQSVNFMNRILFDLHGNYWHRMTKSWKSDFSVTNCISDSNLLKTYGADMRQLDYNYFLTKLELRTRLSDLLQQIEQKKKEDEVGGSLKAQNEPLHPSLQDSIYVCPKKDKTDEQAGPELLTFCNLIQHLERKKKKDNERDSYMMAQNVSLYPSLQNSICVCAKVDKKDEQAGLESTKSLDVNPQESKDEQKTEKAGLESTKSLDVNPHESTKQHQPIRECEQNIEGKKSTKSSQESAEQHLPISEDDKQKKEEANPESVRSSTVPLQQSADNQQPMDIYYKQKCDLLGIPYISAEEYRKMDSSKYQALKNSSAVLEFIECMDNLSPCDTDDVDALVVHLDSQMEMIENMYKRSSAYVNREDYPEPGHSVKLEKSYHEAKLKTRQAQRKIQSA